MTNDPSSQIQSNTHVPARAFVIVLDSVGVGACPDADVYGDVGANTLGNIAAAVGGLNLPNLQRMGLGNIGNFAGVLPIDNPTACVGVLTPLSAGKDTTSGHWELMGLVCEKPFPTYPQGFPAHIMDAFVAKTGYGFLGNYPASGTAIIDELGAEHLRTGKLIVYTSADSVFQIAAHESVVPLDELYRVCETVRNEILVGDDAVGRVIARPFTGDAESGFQRTSGRHDYSVVPTGETDLDELATSGVRTIGVGKISDIFCGQGISESHPTKSNADGMASISRIAQQTEAQDSPVFVFANLVDFDMVWGHRRDVSGYARGLEDFDAWLGDFIPQLKASDLLIVTADHGCDPTFAGSDHTRENVPCIVYAQSQGMHDGTPIKDSFGYVGRTVKEWFGAARGGERNER